MLTSFSRTDGTKDYLRIALFTGNQINVVDGVALTNQRLVRYLEKRGHHVAVFAPGATAKPALEPVGQFIPLPSLTFPIQREYRFALGLFAKQRAQLRHFQPDIIHIATPDWVGHQALRYGQSQGLPVVSAFHTNLVAYMRYTPIARHLQPLGWSILRNFYRKCQQIYVPTPSMMEELQRQGINRGLHLWARGIDHQQFSPHFRSDAWRRHLGIARQEPIVLFVARLRWQKGLRKLAKILQALQRTAIPHRSIIVGDGPALSWLQRELPQTIFLGMLRGEELSRAYASSDLFLYPSDTETFGNVVLEALASGLPIVGADAPGTRSLVIPEENGFLVTPTDLQGFVLRCQHLLANEPVRKQYAQASLKHAKSFHWDSTMEQLVGYYRQALQAQSLKAAG